LTSWDFRRLVETNADFAWRAMVAMGRRLLVHGQPGDG
jgi:hypothetical protein